MRFASVVFDFDSTIVDCETLDLVSEVALAGRDDKDAALEEVRRITALGMDGTLPFHESLSRRMHLIAPTRDAVTEIQERIVGHITPSFLANKTFIREHADSIYIISGGFDEIIFPVSDALGIPRSHVYANAFIYDDSDTAIGVDQERATSRAGGKVAAVRAAGLATPLLIVGDGWTDFELRQEGVADAFLAYVEHAEREKVTAVADAIAHSFDDVLAFVA